MKSLCCHMVMIALLLLSCSKGNDHAATPAGPAGPADTPVTLTPYTIVPPPHFPSMIIPEDNKPYVEKIKLGRMLYYDPILSNDGRACASCHHQAQGFTVDMMVNGTPVLPHVNLAWYSNFMWDGSKQGRLEDVMLFEVKEFFGTDLAKVNNDPQYRKLFRQYFGVNEITYRELSYALAQFVRTMVSRDSKYDRYMRGNGILDYNESRGRDIFFSEKGDCFHCHINPVMTDNLFHNIGLDSVYMNEADKGLYNVTGKNSDIGRFRTPNLRNAALRKRFMHDGRFGSLEEVIAFYNSGVKKTANLDPIMTKPGKEHGLNLTAQQQFQLLRFLQTLTDTTFTHDTTLTYY